jgi:hypothetical protein
MPTKIDTTIGARRVSPPPLSLMQVCRSARTDRVLRFANEAVGIRVSVLSTALFLRLMYPCRYYPISDSALGARQ